MAEKAGSGAWMTFLVGIALVAILAIGAVVYLATPRTPRLGVAVIPPASGAAPHPSPPPLPLPGPKRMG